MAFRRWQVGLEIGNGTLRALAVQRRRQGWCLRHWWQKRLPGGEQGLPPPGADEMLAHWRSALPGSISLRVCLADLLIRQGRIDAPDRRLREPERGWYVVSRASRHFSDDGYPLAFDYQDDPRVPSALLVTAARQSVVDAWQNCLRDAGLKPQVLDIMPCALRAMAGHAGLERDRPLVHRIGDGWCWVSPLDSPLAFGFADRADTADFTAWQRSMAGTLSSTAHTVRHPAYVSSVERAPLPEAAAPWPPFEKLWRVYPPAPPWPEAFVIAGGLAIRQED
ncbi:pilus assembly protein HofM [Martelella alba]|uniref:Pilus assembly protein HofM n=1 Tax=Martelella alba TaxID=2590451 RepID=A0ABY2SI24_9HYPH|nr:pilus assembly protein HofM [Martelella alba]TKI05011.1 pilus assembly protein HofM [Martelella alba]